MAAERRAAQPRARTRASLPYLGLAHIAIRRIGLHPRDSDYEDAVQECHFAILDRGHKWEPARGEWSTFCSAVFRRHLQRWNRIRLRRGFVETWDSPDKEFRHKQKPPPVVWSLSRRMEEGAPGRFGAPREWNIADTLPGRERDPFDGLSAVEIAQRVRNEVKVLRGRKRVICNGILAGQTLEQTGELLGGISRQAVSKSWLGFRAELAKALAFAMA